MNENLDSGGDIGQGCPSADRDVVLATNPVPEGFGLVSRNNGRAYSCETPLSASNNSFEVAISALNAMCLLSAALRYTQSRGIDHFFGHADHQGGKWDAIVPPQGAWFGLPAYDDRRNFWRRPYSHNRCLKCCTEQYNAMPRHLWEREYDLAAIGSWNSGTSDIRSISSSLLLDDLLEEE